MSRTTRLESKFQADLIKELKDTFPDSIILKNDPNYIQGIPDLLILWENNWAALECKRSMTDPLQLNQAWYVTEMNHMSFAAVICPENKEEVIVAIAEAFGAAGQAR